MFNLSIVKKDKLCLKDLFYISSDGNCIAGDMNGFYFRKTHSASFSVERTEGKVTAVAKFLEGVYVIGFENGSVYLFDVNERLNNPSYSGSFLFVMDGNYGGVVNIETFSNYIVTTHFNIVTIYNSITNKIYNLYDHPVKITAHAIFKNNDFIYILTGDITGTFRLAGFSDAYEKRLVFEFLYHKGKIQRIVTDDEYVYILSKDGVISKLTKRQVNVVNWRCLQGKVSDFVIHKNYVIVVGSDTVITVLTKDLVVLKRFLVDKSIKSIHKVISTNNQIFVCGSDGVLYTLNLKEDYSSNNLFNNLSENFIEREIHEPNDTAIGFSVADPKNVDIVKIRATERRWSRHDDIDELVDAFIKTSNLKEEIKNDTKIMFQKLFGTYYRIREDINISGLTKFLEKNGDLSADVEYVLREINQLI